MKRTKKNTITIGMKLTVLLLLIQFSTTVFGQNTIILCNTDQKSSTEQARSDQGMISKTIHINQEIDIDSDININDTIVFNLFADKHYSAVVSQVTKNVLETTTISCSLIGYDLAYCVITFSDSKYAIIIDIPSKNEYYKINFNRENNTYYVSLFNRANMNSVDEAPGILPPSPKMENIEGNMNKDEPSHSKSGTFSPYQQNNLKSVGDPEIITLMVVYTPAAAAWSAANETSINNTISMMLATSNIVLSNSNTNVQLELVHSEQVAYTELNNSNDLYNLRDDGDGIMDNVHTLRDTYCADLVMLLENISFTGGLGYTLNTTSPFGLPTYAFSLVRVQQANGATFTPIHEIGHNMGCHHHKLQSVSPGPGLYSYSAGWRWNGVSGDYCSVMTYTSGTYFGDGITHQRVPYFSNPDVLYEGIPVGNSVDGDNAKTVRIEKSVIASYRNGCCIQPSVQASVNQVVNISDTSATIKWTRGNGSNIIVLLRESNAVNIPPVDGSSYSADSCFGLGSVTQLDNYVVYDGIEDSVTVTNLSPGSMYYYAAYEYNNTDNCYSGSPLTGSFSTFLTPPPIAGQANADTTICENNVAELEVINYYGNIQWQDSPNGTSGWANVSGGTGQNAALYTSSTLSDTTYFRAQISLPGYSNVYSNIVVANVISIDNSLTQVGDTIFSNHNNAVSYQWVDCNNSFVDIFGETLQYYIPQTSGSYAVIIEDGQCVDTSTCMTISFTDIFEETEKTFTIIPNPVIDDLIVQSSSDYKNTSYLIYNSLGQVIMKGNLKLSNIVNTSSLTPGYYTIRIIDDEITETILFFKQ